MSKKQNKLSVSDLKDLHTAGAGFDILRYVALPELMGDEAPTLLYFMGKKIARKFEITSEKDVYELFEKLGIGQLELVKEKKNKKTFYLLADSVVLRINSPIQADFRLEAGLLAEALEVVSGIKCECVEEINYRIGQIQFTVMYAN